MKNNEWNKVQGCTDGGCEILPPQGMCTNGGCYCVPRANKTTMPWYSHEDRRRIIQALRGYRERVKSLEYEVERLKSEK